MLLFLDTEFSDFIDCDLISIGIVAEDGQRIFYAERNDYRRDWVSPFVRDAVLPHLGKYPEAACSRSELCDRLWRWFAELPQQVQIACDSQHDLDLLWDAFGEGLPENLTPKRYELANLLEDPNFHAAVCEYQSQHGQWHHALHDAHAHRAGWLACMAANKKAQR